MCKDSTDPLKQLIMDLQSDETFTDHKIITPLHLMENAHKRLGIQYNNIGNPNTHRSTRHFLQLLPPSQIECPRVEKTTEIFYKRIKADKIGGHDLGNSKNRNAAQQKQAKIAAQNYIRSTNQDIIAFTDGSALNNPGPCGAGVLIHWNGINSQPTKSFKPVSSKSSSYHGELEAIDLALEIILEKEPDIINNNIHLLSNCQSAIYAVTSPTIGKNYFTTFHQLPKKPTL